MYILRQKMTLDMFFDDEICKTSYEYFFKCCTFMFINIVGKTY